MMLGEFQYSFIMFLLAENYESMEHWKNMFCLLSNCNTYIKENPDLFI